MVLAHQFQLRDDAKALWYQISIDSTSGQVVQAINYYSHFSIKAVTLPKKSPNDGFDVVQDPFNPDASPYGWNSDGVETFTDTQGNNVFSSIDGTTINGGASLNFADYNWNSQEDPSSESNRKASVINNFYVSNMVHDITYGYGFDEASGNFQKNKYPLFT